MKTMNPSTGDCSAAPRRARRSRLLIPVFVVALMMAACSVEPEADDVAPVAPTASDGESDLSGESQADGEPTEQAPTTSDKDGGSSEEVEKESVEDGIDSTDDITPPDFADPDDVLVESAFDGPDLSLDSVEMLSSAEQQQVVYHLEGNGFPGWEVEYVDAADTPVKQGQAVLRVVLVGVGSAGPQARDVPVPDGRLTALIVEDPEEDQLTSYVATADGPAPFRVHLQHTPLRLVVDLADET